MSNAPLHSTNEYEVAINQLIDQFDHITICNNIRYMFLNLDNHLHLFEDGILIKSYTSVNDASSASRITEFNLMMLGKEVLLKGKDKNRSTIIKDHLQMKSNELNKDFLEFTLNDWKSTKGLFKASNLIFTADHGKASKKPAIKLLFATLGIKIDEFKKLIEEESIGIPDQVSKYILWSSIILCLAVFILYFSLNESSSFQPKKLNGELSHPIFQSIYPISLPNKSKLLLEITSSFSKYLYLTNDSSTILVDTCFVRFRLVNFTDNHYYPDELKLVHSLSDIPEGNLLPLSNQIEVESKAIIIKNNEIIDIVNPANFSIAPNRQLYSLIKIIPDNNQFGRLNNFKLQLKLHDDNGIEKVITSNMFRWIPKN